MKEEKEEEKKMGKAEDCGKKGQQTEHLLITSHIPPGVFRVNSVNHGRKNLENSKKNI